MQIWTRALTGKTLASAVLFLWLAVPGQTKAEGGTVVAWGRNDFNQADTPAGLTNVTAITVGLSHSLALKSDGTVTSWGVGATLVPNDLTNAVAVGAGQNLSLALKSDGTVAGWGNTVVPAGLTSVAGIATEGGFCLARRRDGTVAHWGMGWNGNNYVLMHPPAGLTNVVFVAAGQAHGLALRRDGVVVAWGDNSYGQTNVPLMLTNVVALAGGQYHSLALNANGTVTAWGSQTDVPPDATNVVAIAAGAFHNLALKADGTIIGWGVNSYGDIDIPPRLTNAIAIAAGGWNSLALVNNSLSFVGRQSYSFTVYSGTTVILKSGVADFPLSGYQWHFNGTNSIGATNALLHLANVQPTNAGSYDVMVTNVYGSVISSNATLIVVTSPPIISSQPTNRVVLPGMDTTFTVSAVGSLPMVFQWRFNGNNIDGATNSLLALTDLQVTNEGNYDVVVSNAFGASTNSSEFLNVIGLAEALDSTNVTWMTGGDTPWFSQGFDTHDGFAAARSGTILDNQRSTLETIVTGPMTLTFWWRVSSEPLSDYLKFSVNGEEQARISGSVVWELKTVYLGPGTQALEWVYSKTNFPHGGMDNAGLDQVSFTPGGTSAAIVAAPTNKVVPLSSNVTLNVLAVGTPLLKYQWRLDQANIDGATNASLTLTNVQLADEGSYSVIVSNSFGMTNSSGAILDVVDLREAVNATNSVWMTGGNLPWFVQTATTHDGAVALQSGGIFHSQQSTVQTTVTGPGTLTYWWKVSSETNNDYVRFTIDGVERARISGGVNWRQETFYLGDGLQNLQWVYNKNGSINAGQDAAWLDQVVYTPGGTSPSASVSPGNASVPFGSNITFNAVVSGTPPFSYQWRFNVTEIADATNSAFGLSNVSLTNEGNYSVVVSNAYGITASSNATLLLRRSEVVVWGGFNQQMTNVPAKVFNPVAIAAGTELNLALNLDGTIVAWGSGFWTNPPASLTNAVAIAAGFRFGLAVKSDGRVVGWGNNSNGQTNPPANLTNAVAVAAGDYHGLALRNDGTVVGWGSNASGQTNPPVGLSNVVAIAAGSSHSLALKSDGTVVAWGSNPGASTNVAKGLSNIVAIAAGGIYSAALKNDGTVVAWGSSSFNLTNSARGLSNVQAVAVGSSHALSLDNSGKVTGLGNNSSGQTNIPAALSNVIAVEAGNYSVALSSFGPSLVYRQPTDRMLYAGMPVLFTASVLGLRPLSCQWQFNGTNIDGATNLLLSLTNVQTVNAGRYSVIVSNTFGNVTSSNALLTVITNPPVFVVQPGDKFAFAGSNVTFLAMATGPVPISYQWQFNGTNLAGATNTTLVLTNVQLTNEGNYALLAANDFGTTESSNAFLNVFDLGDALNATNLVWISSTNPGWIPQMSVSHDGFAAARGNVTSSQSLWLRTSVEGPGTFSFWWQANGSGLTQTYFSMDQNNFLATLYAPSGWQYYTYYIPPGTHTLEWFTFNSGPFSPTMYLDEVSYQPGVNAATVLVHPSSKTVPAGTNVTLTASAGGTPVIRYQWKFNGTNLPNATNSSLSLVNIQTANMGNYALAVTNDFGGEISSNAMLTVNPSAPWIVAHPATKEMVPGGQAAFSVSARGSEPLSYQWEFNFANVSEGTNAALILSNVQSSDAGIYRVTVSNDYGSVTSSFAELKIVPMVIVGWGNDFFGQVTIPFGLTNVAAIGAGWDFSLAAKHNEPVVDWGFPVSDLPSGLTNVVAVVGGSSHSLALGSDGVVTGAGSGSAAVPPPLTNAVGIGAGSSHSIAVKSDGSVVVWGSTSSGRDDIPSDLTNAVAVAGGWLHDMALRSDGSVVAWGSNSFGQTNVPPGLSNVVSIAAGWYYSLAVKDDGAVVAWGRNISGQTNVPSGLTDVVAVAGGLDCSVALKGDGTVVAWGGGSSGETNVPTWLTNVVAIASGQDHNLALLNDGSPYVTRQPWNQTVSSGDTATLRAVVMGTRPMSYQWQLNGTNIDGATNAVLTLTNLPLTAAGSYLCAISNSRGTVLSLPAKLTILRSMPQFDVAPGLHWTNGSFSLRLSGLSGHGDIIIHASSNLLDWEPVLTNPPLVGTLQVLDPSATNRPTRFYRAEEK